MRVGYTRRRNPLSRESGVISKSFLFSYFKLYLYLFIFYIIYNSFSNQTICLSHLLPLNNSRSQLCAFLTIFSFFQLKIVIIWYESPGCADMVVIQSSGSMVADMITALTPYDCQASQNWTYKCRCLEEENAVASQRTGSFFFNSYSWEKRSPQIWR